MRSLKSNDLFLAARMQELCRPPTAWNRALWAVSTQAVLREILEAAEIRRNGILSDAALQDLQRTAMIQLGQDPGVDSKVRGHLQSLMKGNASVTPGSLAAATIEATADDLEGHYLPRWATAVATGITDAMLERCARSVVSHLLNRGHAAKAISDRIHNAIRQPTSTLATASELILDLQALTLQPRSSYRAVFPVKSAPLSKKTNSQGWMGGAQVVEWMNENRVPSFRPGERMVGAVTIDVSARDHISAAHDAASRFVMILDRALLGARKPLEPIGYFWLSGRVETFPIELPNRGVEVASVARQDRIYTVDDGMPSIERAIALLAQLDHGPTSAAVTSGWAALESLAMGPAEEGNRVETAIRVASLIAASFARAELTTLAYAYASSNNDELAAAIRIASTNKERTEKMLGRLNSGPLPSFRRLEDAAAATRMVQLMADPVKTIKRVNSYIECALKRVYRLRNLVVHGGRTDSIVLESGVRVAAPLIGAAFDRIHHASTSEGINPVELISRAQVRMALIGPGHPTDLASLLD